MRPRQDGERPAAPPPHRFRVSRSRLAYAFERYAVRDELITVGEAAELPGLSRELIAMLVLRGRLAVAEEVESPTGRPPRLLLRAELQRLCGENGSR